METSDLIARASAGDHNAFRDLVEVHSHELQVHCYRILGSLQDAEDALQETLVSAWRNLDGFGQRSSLRTWLYQIATNRCLSMLRADSRRPRTATPIPNVTLPEPTSVSDVPPWLEPYPDVLLDNLVDPAPGPETRYETTEAISLTTSPARTVAFVHLGSWSVADTTYLGRRFKRSSHSPLMIDDRAPKYSSLRRPISSASAPCASASSSSAHASQSWPMN
jgi:RNA polymerase sigma factor (sigma-70 family)